MPPALQSTGKKPCSKDENTSFTFSSNFVLHIYSWGIGTNGQLGHAKFEKNRSNVLTTEDDYIQKVPRRILKSKEFEKIECGSHTSFALDNAGRLFGWGNLENVGKFTDKVMEPTAIDLDRKFTSVAAGESHYAAIDDKGLVYTWGRGSFGNTWFTKTGGLLGHGDNESVRLPTKMEHFEEYGAKAVSVQCGDKHTLILTEDGEVLACGVGEYGRLGTGSTSDALVPATLEALLEEDIVQVSAGASHSLALSKKGVVYAWGRNDMGQLGAGDSYMDIYSVEDIPRAIDSDSLNDKHVVSISAGKGRSACITADGELFMWGNKLNHEPMQVLLNDDVRVVKVVCGGRERQHCIAIIMEDGSLWTMGDGESHMLGRREVATKNPTFERVEAFDGKRVLDVQMGLGNHILAIVEEEI